MEAIEALEKREASLRAISIQRACKGELLEVYVECGFLERCRMSSVGS
jgi:hypothetical protein